VCVGATTALYWYTHLWSEFREGFLLLVVLMGGGLALVGSVK